MGAAEIELTADEIEILEATRPATCERLRSIASQIEAAGGRGAPALDFKAAQAKQRELAAAHRASARVPAPGTVRASERKAAEAAEAEVRETKTRALLVAKLLKEEADHLERIGHAGKVNPFRFEAQP